MTDEELDGLWDVINLLDDGMAASDEQREDWGPLHRAVESARVVLAKLVLDE